MPLGVYKACGRRLKSRGCTSKRGLAENNHFAVCKVNIYLCLYPHAYLFKNVCVIYIYMFIMYMYIYIYVYIDLSLYVYIYIYGFVELGIGSLALGRL